jgi:hypothetical protein
VGASWMTFGVIYGAWKTHGFKKDLISFDVPPDD